MFDLNEAVTSWRRRMLESGVRERIVLDELEAHLRDEIEQLGSEGLGPADAFAEAERRMGDSQTLNEEFAKNRGLMRRGVEWIGGGLLAMKDSEASQRSELFTAFLLFAGFGGLLGWLGTAAFMTANTGGFRDATFLQALSYSVRNDLYASFFLVFATGGLAWGWRRLRHHAHRQRCLLGALMSALVAWPAIVIGGVAAIIMAPYLYGMVLHGAGKLVASAASPDGRWVATVRDMPSMDGPDDRYRIQAGGGGEAIEAGHLMEDVDFFKNVHWSPASDIVVFESHYALFAVRPADMASAVIPLAPGAAMVWHGGTFSIRGVPASVDAVSFPSVGGFSYRLMGSDRSIDVGPNAFTARPPGFLVNQFAQEGRR